MSEIRPRWIRIAVVGVLVGMVAGLGQTARVGAETKTSAPVSFTGGIYLTFYRPFDKALVILGPDGQIVDSLPRKAPTDFHKAWEQKIPSTFIDGRVSPDGKRFAAIRQMPILPVSKGPWVPTAVQILKLEQGDEQPAPCLVDLQLPSICWSPDGTKLYCSEVDPKHAGKPREDGKPVPFVTGVFDLKTQELTRLSVPTGHLVVDVSPDGKTLLTKESLGENWFRRSHLHSLATGETKLLLPDDFEALRFSPDGRMVLGKRKPAGKPKEEHPMAVVNVENGTWRDIPLPARFSQIRGAAWSPDGKKIAFLFYEKPPNQDRDPADYLRSQWTWVGLADADGGNARVFFANEKAWELRSIDWK